GITVEPKLSHAAVGGVGDEAFDSPDGPQRRAIYVRKGKEACALTANVVHDASGDRLAVTMDQLRSLAKLAASHMKANRASVEARFSPTRFDSGTVPGGKQYEHPSLEEIS
ncbi:MAG: hypothetical protein ACREH9_13695, partial [Pseudomonadota bacterium]